MGGGLVYTEMHGGDTEGHGGGREIEIEIEIERCGGGGGGGRWARVAEGTRLGPA